LKGLGFGFGLLYVGEREAELPNDFALPSYVRSDAAIFYQGDRWRAGLNFKNLFNTTYYESSQNSRLIYPGEPFSVSGTFSINF
jgi:iron complex outermembrane receptor protein